jgi:xanthine dehydrogenase accessory factor
VCDARPVFATASRFPDAHEVVVRWPHEYLAEEIEAGRIDSRTALCVLTHDPKFDVPLLTAALTGPEVAYVGAMGSRRTHTDRLRRLRESGLTEAQLAKLSSPVGLNLGARTPEETAVSIAAEIIALQWGGDGDRLTETSGPIHQHAAAFVDAGPAGLDEDAELAAIQDDAELAAIQDDAELASIESDVSDDAADDGRDPQDDGAMTRP